MIPTSTTQIGAGQSLMIVHDSNLSPTDILLSTVVTPPVNYTIQHTADNVFTATYNPALGNWFNSNDPKLNNATAGVYSKLDVPVTASRINNNGQGTVVLTARQGVKG